MARVDVHKAKEVRLDRHLHASVQTGPPKCRRRQVRRPATTEGGHMSWAPNVRTSAAIRLASLALTALGVAACRDSTEPPRPAVPRPALNLVSQITVTDLGTLGGRISRAFAINDIGQVAGYSQTSSGSEHAFLW